MSANMNINFDDESFSVLMPNDVEFFPNDDEDNLFDDMEPFYDDDEDIIHSPEFVKERAISEIIYGKLRENLNAISNYGNFYPEDPDDAIEMALNFEERLFESFIEQIQLSDEIAIGVKKVAHQKLFRAQIFEELIAEALHPRRMMTRMQQFDDIEQFFECC